MSSTIGRQPSLPPPATAARTLPLAPPGGMRDLLPPASAARKLLSRCLVDTFALYGYDRVTTPPFEHADVLERGLATVDRRDLLRFVEPDTGEVALLRPDITPQIARIIATRLLDRPAPFRLCYEGEVIRRRRGRARRQQQIAQTGVECVGIAGPDGDVEVIALAARACEAVGLRDFRIELGQVGLGSTALEAVPEEARPNVTEALSKKDRAGLEALLLESGTEAGARDRLLGLVDLYGDVGVIDDARAHLRGADLAEPLDRLHEVADRLVQLGLGDRLGVDLGEVRGQAYYTGVSFTLLAPGPGVPIGAGGRYDNLMGKFGAPAPATGFALDVENLEWALRAAGAPFEAKLPLRVAIAGPEAGSALDAVADVLRARGVTAARLASLAPDEALSYARAWGYDAVLRADAGTLRAVRAVDGLVRTFNPDSPDHLESLEAWARPDLAK